MNYFRYNPFDLIDTQNEKWLTGIYSLVVTVFILGTMGIGIWKNYIVGDSSFLYTFFIAAFEFVVLSLIAMFISKPLAVLSIPIRKIMNLHSKNKLEKVYTDIQRSNGKNALFFAGVTTGTLLEKGHHNSLAPQQFFGFDLDSACQNFICFGGIGSGKTSRFMLPISARILNNRQGLQCGGLVFDVKGDFHTDFLNIAGERRKDITLVGVGTGNGFNLLDGLSPEMAASYLNSVFYLSGDTSDAFWVDSATELCKNSLGVLKYSNNFDLHSLYKFIFDKEFQLEQCTIAAENVLTLDEHEQQVFEAYLGYINNVFAPFDEKMKQSIKATVSQALSNFQHPDLVNAFCRNCINSVNMYDVLNGKIFVIQLPLAIWGVSAKVVYSLIKLRFFSLIQERLVNKNLDNTRPVIFVCDEYQNLISASKNGLSDLTFWDKSRSARCIGIVSTQSISSFYSALHNKELADTILQNFRQKFCFRSEDVTTIEYFQRLAGEVEVERVSTSQTESVGKSNFDILKTYKTKTTSTTVSQQMRKAVDGQLLRGLSQDTALMFANVGGQAWDDVLIMQPYYAMTEYPVQQ